MKKKLLRPDQIITLRDYPVYNQHILKIFFRVFHKNQGKILPPCPVLHKSLGIPFVKGKDSKSKKYNNLLRKYLENNPRAQYFLLDGGHKTAAATLAHRQIPVLLIEKDQDFKKARKLIEKGEMFGWYGLEKSVKQAVGVLTKHHFGTKHFQTVEEKVKKMVRKKDVPAYIISVYKKQN